MSAELKAEVTAPYVPFKTFQTALDRLQGGNIPHRIDKSVFPSFAYATINQLLAAFRFFGLIDESGVPTSELEPLTVIEQQRVPALKKMLERAYPDLIAIDLVKATPDQLDQAFKKYNVTGVTLRKAVTFFLQAAKFSNLPMSPLLEGKSKKGAPTGSRRRRAATNGNPDPVVVAQPEVHKTSSGTSRIITLASGGKLTLEVELDVLRLKGEDRAFVFGLIDSLEEYEKKNKKETTENLL